MPKGTESTTKFKADISELKKGMQEAARQVRLANSEFKAATAGMDNWAQSADGLTAKVKQLDSVLDAQKKQLKSLEQQYELTKKEMGENSKGAQELLIKINNQKAAIGKTEKEIKSYTQRLEEVKNETDDLEGSMKDAERATENMSDGFTVAKGVIADLVADGIQTMISSLKDFATESQGAYQKFQAATGASADEMEKFRKEMDEMYTNAYGENLEDIGDKMVYIKQVTGETDPSKIRELAENAITLEETFGSDFNETIRGVSNLMEHFGISSEEAFDLFAKGSQEGLDYTGELGDNVAEYGGNFQQAGYSADEYFQLLKNGSENGAYNLDKVNDSINEIKNRIGDGTIEKNIDMFGKGTKSAFKAWQNGKGTMKDVIDSIVSDINNCENEQEALTMAATAFGTMGEDANLKVVKSLTTTGDAFDNVGGKMNEIKDIRYDDVGTQFKELGRTLQIEFIKPLAEKAYPYLEKFATYTIDNIDKIITLLTGAGIAMGTIFAVNKTATFIQSILTMTSTFKSVTTAIKGAESATKLLSVAQMSLPLVAIAAGVTAVVAALALYNKKHKEAIEKEYGLTEAQKQTIESAKKLSEEYNNMDSARNKAMSGVSAEYGHLQELKTEYNKLVDSNGKIKKGYEDRANFIINQLASALGVQVSEIQKVIDQNGKLGDSINDIIQKKKAEAMLSANQDAYTEAIQKRQDALQTYQNNLATLEAAEKKYNETKDEANKVMDEFNALLAINPEAAANYYMANRKLIEGNLESEKSYNEAKKALEESESAYVGYNATIQNYEGLSSAIISGDAKKINSALQNIENGFITAESGTKSSLEKQVQNAKTNYENLKKAIDENTPGVTEKMVKQAKQMVDKSEKELAKLTPKAKEAGKKAGQANADGLESKKKNAESSGKKVSNKAKQGLESADTKRVGEKKASEYAEGVTAKKGDAKTSAKSVSSKAKEGLESADTEKSGEYFSQGFINGLGNLANDAWEAAKSLAKKAWNGLKKGQEEGSPSKLTYKSGRFFTMGYINGISSMQKSLVKTVKGMIETVVSEMANLSNYNFSDVGNAASNAFGDAISQKASYMLDKMTYQNEKKLESFDKQIKELESKQSSKVNALQKASDKKVNALQKKYDAENDKNKKASLKKQINAEKASVKKQIASVEKQYTKLINNQNKYKEAYQTASTEMLSEFTTAINEYQQKAQALIDDTINGITTKYQSRYDDLIGKQDTLISKLKSAGDLFEISGAGIMTVNDIKQQTKDIKEYTKKLQAIKSKVSSELFDQIASYDMEQGSAFMDRLLALSDADLKAYSDAYDEKMKTAEKLAGDTYKGDFENVAKEYKTELKSAFKTLPDELETIGNDTMSGFVKGLTKNTDYLSKSVQTLVKAMVDQFKTQLDINSPSRVLEQIGEYSGEGLGDGLRNMVSYVANSVEKLANTVTNPLDDIKGYSNDVKSTVNSRGGIRSASGGTGNTVVNNYYELVQNNNSPKSLSALDTYRARRQQIAMVKAMT